MAIASNGPVQIAYDLEGEGEPLLLIAGTAASRSLWGYVRPALNARHRTVAFDNRDAGDSSLVSEPYSL